MKGSPPPPDAATLDWAKYYHNLGLHPLPVHPETKFPAVKWAEYQTRQPTLEEIEKWKWSGGIGIVTTGLICVDCDDGGEQLLKGKDFPPSWTVRTGSGGLHRYYRANGKPARNAVAILKEDGKGQVDIRGDGGFIIVPPTKHIKTGKPYEWTLPPWLDTLPLAPAPAWIQEAVTDKRQTPNTQSVQMGKRIPNGQRDSTLTSLAGTMRRRGMDEEAILAALLKENEAKCDPPLPEHDVRKIAHSVTRYEPEKPQEEPDLPAEAPESDLPTFPEAAYQGLAAEIAHTYAECLEAPKEFFYMDTLAFQGVLLSTQIQIESQLYEEPRLYVVKVGPSWSARKSSSQDNIERFFEPLRDRITMCYGTGSAEGLAKRMQSGLPALLVYDEFRSFVDKSSVQQSVLLPMVGQLFHRTIYENSTKERDFRLTDAHLSLVGACTTETFTTMFTPQFRNIGFLNRLFVVTGKRTSLKPIPKQIPPATLQRLRDRVIGQVDRAEREKPRLQFTSDARRRWEEWYRAMPDSPYTARLDTYGLRLLMLYAVTTESWQITRTLVDAVIPLLDYELAVRRELDPIDAEGKIARMERLILRHLSKGRMAKSRLQTLCNVRHYGTWVFEKALANIMRQGWVKETPVGRGRHLWLTETGEEATKQ